MINKLNWHLLFKCGLCHNFYATQHSYESDGLSPLCVNCANWWHDKGNRPDTDYLDMQNYLYSTHKK